MQYTSDIDRYLGWSKAILLLSLDRVAPLWDRLELKLTPSEELKGLLRKNIRDRRALAETTLPNADFVGPAMKRLDSLVADLAKAFGPDAGRELHDWVEQSFVPLMSPGGWKIGWTVLLGKLQTLGWQGLTALGMADAQIGPLVSLGEQFTRARLEIKAKIQEADQAPFSAWDGEQLALKQGDVPEFSLLDPLKDYLVGREFDRTWQQILQILKPAEMDILSEWGEKIAQLQGSMPLDMAVIPTEKRALS